MAIPFLSDISGQGATFVGDVTMTQTSGNNILYINSSAGGNPVIYMEDSAVKWGQFVASGELYFKNETTNVNTLKLIGSNATFAGQITTTQNQITTNIGTTSAIRLKPGSTTNTTGKSSIFLGTSPVDNYGISLRGARLGSDGTPTFELATHDGSANGTVALSIDNTANATFAGDVIIGDNQKLHGGRVHPRSVYSTSNTNGFLIATDLASNAYGMIQGEIDLIQFNSSTKQRIEFSATLNNNGTVFNSKGTADIGITIKLFVYNSKWYVHVPQASTYMTCTAYISKANAYVGDDDANNSITNLTSGAIPSSGVTGSTEIACKFAQSDAAFGGDITQADGKRIWFRNSSASSGTGAQSYIHSDGLNLKIKGDDNVKILGDGGGTIAHFDYTGKVGIGKESGLGGLLHIKGSGDAIRVESTNTGSGGAQIDLLHFTTSPADEDTHGVINMGGYYTGTTSVYGTQIKSIWTDVSDRDARLEFRTVSAGSISTALTLAHDNWAMFGSSIDIAGGQITTPSGTNLALNPNTGIVTVGGVIQASGTGNNTFAGAVVAEDNIHLTDAGTVRAKLLLNASDRDNVELRAESLGSTMKFFTVGTEALELDANQNAIFAARVGIGTNLPSTFLQVSGQGNRAGGNIQMGLSSQGADKWSYLTGTHYNSTTEPEGFALIGGYSDIDENRVVIGGDIWETNPSTSIHFWTHNSSTHAQGGTQKMVIKGDGKVGIGQTTPTHTLHVKNSTGDVRGIMIEQAFSASYAELAFKSDLREFRLGTGGNGTNNANAENLFYIYDATTGGAAGHRFEINSLGEVQARRPRSNTAGDVALSLQPTDSTIHYGFRIDQTTNSFNLDRSGTNLQLLRVETDGDATFTKDVTAEGGILYLGKANTASGHINSKELMTFNIDTDNDDTNRYFGFYVNGESGSGTELLKIEEDGAATFAGDVNIATASATSSGKLTVQSQGANGSDKTALVLRNYSAAPFTGRVTTEYEVGTVNIAEVSAVRIDSNNGQLRFKTKQNGTIADALTLKQDASATFAGEVDVPHGKISILGGNNLTISGTASNHAGLSFATNAILPCAVSATNTNIVDLGATSEKFKDAHFGGTINAVNVAISGTLSGAGSFVPVGGGTFTGRISHPHKKYCDVSISNSYVRVYSTGVTNSQLATIVRLTGTAHGSSHVGTFTAKIMVGHYRDVQIESMQGFYPDDTSNTTRPTLKVEGDGNGQYTLSMKTASTSAATYYFTIESLSDQTSITTLPSSTASTTISHEHECTQGKNLTHLGRNNQTKIFKIQGDADFNGTLNVVNHASTSSVATQFINGKRTSGTVPIGELIFSNNNDSVATVAGYRDGEDNKGSLLFQTQDGSNGFGTRLTIKADGVSTFEKNLKANENLFVSGDGSVFGNASGLFVDSANTNYNIQAADGIAFGGSAYTFANIFGDSFGNITVAANAYPANTGSESKITFKTSTQSGGTYIPLKIKGNTSTFDGQIAGQDGTDLVTNGSFSGVSDGTDVAGLTGWNAYGSVTSRNITGEQLVLVTTAANTGAVLTVTTVVGQVYHVTADASGNLGTNGIHVDTTAEGAINHSTADGVDFYFTAAATSTLIYFRASTNAAGTANFDNVSVKEVVGYHLGDGRLNITKQAAGDARLKLVTTSAGDPNITFNSKAANRSAVINFEDNGTQSGQITYKHNGDTMEFYTGGASSPSHLELKLNETTGATFRTKATFGGDVLPSADASKNLGSGALRWATLRANYGDFNQSSTTDPVLRLTDAGVANYDVVFPDTSTYRLQTDTSSTKTFDIKNLGSGGFNLEVGGAISSSGGDLMLSSGKLNVTGAGSFITHGTSWGQNLKLTNTNDDVSPPILTFLKEQASGHSAIADNDYVGFTNYRMKNTNGDEFSWVELSALAKDVTDGSEDSAYRVGVWGGGTEQPNAIYTSADANGVKIGLGTASPDKCLTVYAPTYAGIDIKTAGGKLWEAEQWFADEGYQGMYKAGVKKIQFRADGPSYFNSGNVGIGTGTNIDTKFHVEEAAANTSCYATVQSASWNAGLTLKNGNGTWEILNDYTGLSTVGSLAFYSGTYRMVLDNAGNMMLGATALNGSFGASNTVLAIKGSTSGGEGILQITGLGNNATDNVGRIDFHSQAEADAMAAIRCVRGNADDVGELEFFTNSGGSPTKALTIDSNQNAVFAGPVWISDYIYHTGDSGTKFGFSANDTFVVRNAGAVRLTVASNGDCTATGDVVAYSDERLKTNIKTLDGSKVYEMRGVSFIKEDKEGSGVIAQELEKIAPELVNSDSEYKAVAYGNLTGYLIEAIKELKAEIEELKKQIK